MCVFASLHLEMCFYLIGYIYIIIINVFIYSPLKQKNHVSEITSLKNDKNRSTKALWGI